MLLDKYFPMRTIERFVGMSCKSDQGRTQTGTNFFFSVHSLCVVFVSSIPEFGER